MSSPFTVRVVLSHRVRNAEGGWHWQPVTPQDQLRVTKNRGKVLRISVDAPLPYRSTDVSVYLVDNAGEDTTSPALSLPALPGVRLIKDGLTLQSISEPARSQLDQSGGEASYATEVIAKLNKICRQLQVYVVINALRPQPLVGRSVEFQTHNTGKKTSKGEWELTHAHPPHQLKPILPHHATQTPLSGAAAFSASSSMPQQQQQQQQQHSQQHLHHQLPQQQPAGSTTSPTGGSGGHSQQSPVNSSPSHSSHSSPSNPSPAYSTTTPTTNNSPLHPQPHPQQPQPQQQFQPQQQPPFVSSVQYVQQMPTFAGRQQPTPSGQAMPPQQQAWQSQSHHPSWAIGRAAGGGPQPAATATAAHPTAQYAYNYHGGHQLHQSAVGSVLPPPAPPVIQAYPLSGSMPSRVVLHRHNSQPHIPQQMPSPYGMHAPLLHHHQQQHQHQQQHGSVSCGGGPAAVHPAVRHPSWAYGGPAPAYPSGDYAPSPVLRQQQPAVSRPPHVVVADAAQFGSSPERSDVGASATESEDEGGTHHGHGMMAMLSAAMPRCSTDLASMIMPDSATAALAPSEYYDRGHGGLDAALGSISSSSSSSAYDSSDGLLASSKRTRGNDGDRIRLGGGAGGGDGVDSSDGEHDFYRHPETVEARQGGVSIHAGLHVKGLVRAQAFLHYSDLRLKTSVEDIVDAIETLSKLEGKRYTWRKDIANSPIAGSGADEIDREIAYLQKYVDLNNGDESEPETQEQPGGVKVLGLIAQEVQRVLPEIVKEDADGWLSIDYAEIVPILIEAFKEHMQDYHRTQACFREEFEAFKGQMRERTEAKAKSGGVAGEANDDDDLSSSHESGDDNDVKTRKKWKKKTKTTKAKAKAKANNTNNNKKRDDHVDDYDDDEEGSAYELDEISETRPLAQLSFHSKLDVKELAERMSSLIPPRPYNELLHNLRTAKRKKKVKQRSFGVAFMSIGTFLLVINAILAASIPIFVYHLGSSNGDSSTLLYDYSVGTARTYSVSVQGNVVSVSGNSVSNSTSVAKRAVPRPPPNGFPNDEIVCRMLSGDATDDLIFQAEFSWNLVDPRGGQLAVNYIVEILNIIEYQETDMIAGYQKGEEVFIFGNSTGMPAIWNSWNVTNRTQDNTQIRNWRTYTKDKIFSVHCSVSERSILDDNFGHNLTSNSILIDLVINDFPFVKLNTSLAIVMRIRSKDPMVLVTVPTSDLLTSRRVSSLGASSRSPSPSFLPPSPFSSSPSSLPPTANHSPDPAAGGASTNGSGGGGGDGGSRAAPSPPAWCHKMVVVDKTGNGTIVGNVQGVFTWPLQGTYGNNISDTLAVDGDDGGIKTAVIVERLLSEEQIFNAPGPNGVAPKEVSRVFAFSFYEAPQVPVYYWSVNIGVDNIS